MKDDRVHVIVLLNQLVVPLPDFVKLTPFGIHIQSFERFLQNFDIDELEEGMCKLKDSWMLVELVILNSRINFSLGYSGLRL